MTASDELVAAADRYLQGKRCVIWQSFTIEKPSERRKAAGWLAEQVAGVLVEKGSGTAFHDLGLVGGK